MAGTSIIPASPALIPISTTGPADGELANAASVNGAFLDLMSGVLGVRIGTYGRVANVHCRSSNGTDIVVDALGSVLLTTGGATSWLSLLNSTPQSVTAATALGSALGNNVRYYLYAYYNGTGLAFIVNTTAPNVSRTYENGNTDHIFVSTFVTDGSGIIIPYVQTGRQVRYSNPYQGPSVATNTGGGVWTDVNFNATTPMIPTWAQSVTLLVDLSNSDTTAGGDLYYLRPKGITASGNYNLQAIQFYTGTVTGYLTHILTQVELHTNDSQLVQYAWVAGGAGRAGALSVAGWSY